MKKLFCIAAALFILTSDINSQIDGYKTHLFLGTWILKSDKNVTTEKWELTDKGEMKGMTIYESDKGSFLSETMRITEMDGKLNLCVTILEENPDNTQGEICFTLKSYNDKVFLFENKRHDFPKRIIYDFNGYDFLTAIIAGDTNSFDLIYQRIYNPLDAFTLKCKIIKEQFTNKAGRNIENVFDYFCDIQGEKYFIKLSAGNVSRDILENNLGKDIICTVVFESGLWDTDNPDYQSRTGKYITIKSIKH